MREMGQLLEARGHQVTYILPRGDKMPADGIRNPIFVTPHNEDQGVPYIKPDGSVFVPSEKFWRSKMTMSQFMYDYLYVPEIQCRAIVDDKSVVKRIEKGNFSLAIVDMLGNECALALLRKMDIPTIGYYSPLGSAILSVFENPALTPLCTTGFSNRMTFFQRAYNVIGYAVSMVTLDLFYMFTAPSVRRRIPDAPWPADVVEDLALFFMQGDPFTDYPRQLPPNYRQMGCMRCKSPEPLPSEIEAIMQNSGENGVVLVSFGFTMVREGEVPDELLQLFMDVAYNMNQTVIMNFPLDPSVDRVLPENMHVYRWLPIQDILGHRKTKAFVTHCGFASMMEAVYHAVPIVALPIYFEQTDLAQRVVDRGYGIMLDKFSLDSHVMFDALNEVIYNESYKTTLDSVSERLQNHPFGPRDELIYWSEYIMKYRETSHFKMPTGDLNRFQRCAVDVFIFWAAIFATGFAIFYFIAKRAVLWLLHMPQAQSWLEYLQSSTAKVLSKRFVGTMLPSPKLLRRLKID